MNAEPLSDKAMQELRERIVVDDADVSGRIALRLLDMIDADRKRIDALKGLVLEAERTIAARDKRIAELEECDKVVMETIKELESDDDDRDMRIYMKGMRREIEDRLNSKGATDAKA